MGTSKSRSGTGLHAAVVEMLEARQLLAATVANFTGGNGTSSVDQYTGIAGSGWATTWTTDTYKTTSTAGVLSTNPLNGGGNYLSGTWTGSGTPSLAAFARAYSTVTGGVDTGQAHTISFDVRVDSDLSTFTDNQDRINIWGDDSLNYGTTSGSASGLTWVLTAYGAATNGVPVAKNWTWQGGDRAGNYGPILDTGIPLVQGHVYHVVITNDPVSQSYVGSITDLQTSATNTSPVLAWRTGHAFTSTTNTYLMVGGEKQASSGKTTTIATDSINIAPAPPAAPTSLTATVSSSQVNLAWTDNAFDESGYVVQRAVSGSGSWADYATRPANATSYTDTNATPGVNYAYRVRGTNGAGDSAYSNTAYATVPTGTTVPNAPSNLAAIAASATQVNLTWTDNSTNETGFKIDRSTSSTFASGVTTTTVAANVISYAASGLTAGNTYYFRVRATNAAGDSANSNTASARTSAPNAPSALSAAAASSSQVNLTWTDNSTDETGFKVDRATNSTFTAGLTTATVTAGTTTYAATGLAASTTYYFRVRATNAVGDSANCNPASAVTAGNSSPTIGPLTSFTPASGTFVTLTVGAYTVPHSSSAGTLTACRVNAPNDPDEPFVYGVDYNESVNASGDVLVSLSQDGSYVVQSTYSDSQGNTTTTLTDLLLNCATGAPTNINGLINPSYKLPNPHADLVLVDDTSPTATDPSTGVTLDNGYLHNARHILVYAGIPFTGVDSVQEVVAAMDQLWLSKVSAGDPSSSTLLVVGHGASGFVGVGNAQYSGVGQRLELNDPDGSSDLQDFVDAMARDNFSAVTFYECEVGRPPYGDSFLQYVATNGATTAGGYTSFIYDTFNRWYVYGPTTEIVKTP